MLIAENKVVTVSYELHANMPNQERKHIETAEAEQPLSFIFGLGMMIPGFEKGLEGKTQGDEFSFSIAPEEAYGIADESAVIKLPLDIFKVDNAIDFSILQVDNILPMSDNEGNVLNGRVLAYDDAQVTMDFNHPLAGQELHFAGKILTIREATPEEIEHGHVH